MCLRGRYGAPDPGAIKMARVIEAPAARHIWHQTKRAIGILVSYFNGSSRRSRKPMARVCSRPSQGRSQC